MDSEDMASVETLLHIKLKVFGQEELVTFELSPSTTFLQFKEMICERGLGAVSRMRLLCRGRLLNDSDTVEGCGLKDGNVVHLVVREIDAAPAAPAPAAPAAQPSSTRRATGSNANIPGLGNINDLLRSGEASVLSFGMDEDGNVVSEGDADIMSLLSGLGNGLGGLAGLGGNSGSSTTESVSTAPRGVLPPPPRWFPQNIDRAITDCLLPERDGEVHSVPYVVSTSSVNIPLHVPLNQALNAGLEAPVIDLEAIATAALQQFRAEAPVSQPVFEDNAATSIDVQATVEEGSANTNVLRLTLPPITGPSPLPEDPAFYGIPLYRLASIMTSLAPALAAFAHEVRNEDQLTDLASVAVLRTHSRTYGSIMRRLGTALIDLGSAMNHIDYGEPNAPLGTNSGHPGQTVPGSTSHAEGISAVHVRGNRVVSPPVGVVDDGTPLNDGTLQDLSNAPDAVSAGAPARLPARLFGPVRLQHATNSITLNQLLNPNAGSNSIGDAGNYISVGQAMPPMHRNNGDGTEAEIPVIQPNSNNNNNNNNGMGGLFGGLGGLLSSVLGGGMGGGQRRRRTGGTGARSNRRRTAATTETNTTTTTNTDAMNDDNDDPAPVPSPPNVPEPADVVVPDEEDVEEDIEEYVTPGANGSNTNRNATQGTQQEQPEDPFASMLGNMMGSLLGGGASGGAAGGSLDMNALMGNMMGMLGSINTGAQAGAAAGAAAVNPLMGMLSGLMSNMGGAHNASSPNHASSPNENDASTTSSNTNSDDHTNVSESSPFPSSTSNNSLLEALMDITMEHHTMDLMGIVLSNNWTGLDRGYTRYHDLIMTRAATYPSSTEGYAAFSTSAHIGALSRLTDDSVDSTLELAMNSSGLEEANKRHPLGAIPFKPSLYNFTDLPALVEDAVAAGFVNFADVSQEKYHLVRTSQALCNLVGPHVTNAWSYIIALAAFGPAKPDNTVATHPQASSHYMLKRVNAPRFAETIDHTVATAGTHFGFALKDCVIYLFGGLAKLLKDQALADGDVSLNLFVQLIVSSAASSSDMGMVMPMLQGMLGDISSKTISQFDALQSANGATAITMAPPAVDDQLAQAQEEEEEEEEDPFAVLPEEERAQWIRYLEQDAEAQQDIHGYFFNQRRSKLVVLGADPQIDVLPGGRIRVHPQPLSQQYLSGSVAEYKAIKKTNEAVEHAVEYLQAKKAGTRAQLKGTVNDVVDASFKNALQAVKMSVKKAKGEPVATQVTSSLEQNNAVKVAFAKQMLHDVKKLLQQYPDYESKVAKQDEQQ